MQKVLHINPDKCTGCLQCEMACSFENYGVYATSKSRMYSIPPRWLWLFFSMLQHPSNR